MGPAPWKQPSTKKPLGPVGPVVAVSGVTGAVAGAGVAT